MLTMADVQLQGKRVLIRVDFNVPMQQGAITDASRIEATLPTIKQALQAGAAVILLSHLGRPTEGEYDPAFSLAPVAKKLSELLGQAVRLQNPWLNGFAIMPGEVVLCENVRFNRGEESDDDVLAQQIARLGDIFVMDAFAAAHRAHASTHGVAKYAPLACAGPLVVAELNALTAALSQPQRPLLAIVGGSKVSTKLSVLSNLLRHVDQLIVGGALANTFLVAAGFSIGSSRYEAELVATAQSLLAQATATGAHIPLPTDVVVAKSFNENATAYIRDINAIEKDDMILDIGPQTAQQFTQYIKQAKTIVWNGPVGVFEWPAFAQGTVAIAQAIAESTAFSVAGGGDTLAAINQFHIADKISYISTAGGAFLEFLAGDELPALTVLQQ